MTQCRLIANPELDEHGNVDTTKRQVGDMWFLDLPVEELKKRNLTAHYWAHNAGRKPLVVMLPGRLYFLIDSQCYESSKGYYDGWTVTGTPPNISVSPSIHFPGRYHGMLTSGVISPDIDSPNRPPPPPMPPPPDSIILGEHAHEVIGNLWVGDSHAAQEWPLDSPMLCVLEGGRTAARPAYWIPILKDAKAQRLQLDACAVLISHVLSQGSRLLVHCGAGVERSPLTVAWYLVTFKRYATLDAAYERLKTTRAAVADRREWLEELPT